MKCSSLLVCAAALVLVPLPSAAQDQQNQFRIIQSETRVPAPKFAQWARALTDSLKANPQKAAGAVTADGEKTRGMREVFLGTTLTYEKRPDLGSLCRVLTVRRNFSRECIVLYDVNGDLNPEITVLYHLAMRPLPLTRLSDEAARKVFDHLGIKWVGWYQLADADWEVFRSLFTEADRLREEK